MLDSVVGIYLKKSVNVYTYNYSVEYTLFNSAMSSAKFSINFINIFALLHFLATRLKAKKQKTYDYTSQVAGQDYVFEPVENYAKGYMTAQLKGVEVGDFITLQDGAEVYCYQVEQIDYYANPSDMWTAVLRRVIVNS
jgi:MioC protein